MSALKRGILKNKELKCLNYKTKLIHDWTITPRQTKKLFMPNIEKSKTKLFPKKKPTPSFEVKAGPRTNKMGIQMLSKSLYSKIFKGYKIGKEDISRIEECKTKLLSLGMVTNEDNYTEDVDLEIPALLGENLEEHFYKIGEMQAKPYTDIIHTLLKNIPLKPKQWVMKEGWTKYVPNKEPESVPFPDEPGLVLDVEVCMQAGQAPSLATAVSNTAWYGWVSKSLIDGVAKPVTNNQYTVDTLIPLETTSLENSCAKSNSVCKPRIVVGHNVSYDRARIKEQYWFHRSGLRFLDTMSLHICVSGLTSYQRALLKSKKDTNEDEDTWKQYSSLNSLSEVHNLYCGKQIEKETRNIFVDGSLNDIKSNFQNVMDYCSRDVEATYHVLQNVFPLFLQRFPHPVTFAGMLELGTGYLPVNSNWERYINNAEQTYEDLDIESKLLLARRADQACQFLHKDTFKENVWMWDQDWEIKELKLKKETIRKRTDPKQTENEASIEISNNDDDFDALHEKFYPLFNNDSILPAKLPLLAGYPKWYRKLCTKPNSFPEWVPGPHLISTSMQITPKLLSLMWEGYPLHYIRGHGWGFLIPFTEDITIERKLPLQSLLDKCPITINKPKTGKYVNDLSKDVEESLARYQFNRKNKSKHPNAYNGSGVWCDIILEECCWFYKLPHKNGPSYKVGNPLAKDFLNKFSENVLSGDTESAERVLSIARQLSYWRNNKNRIMGQMVVKLDEYTLNKAYNIDHSMYGSIIPQVVVCGTLTRRAVEPTWMTASNANVERIGSELRAMVQAPPGYCFVGADVDSQELWIASVIGDAYHANMHGCTPLGWMTLSGDKAHGTDMHSVTAKAIGISREHAKVINYARIYGAGQKFAERLLKQFNPTVSDSEVKTKASKMFTFTKGKQIYTLKDEYLNNFSNDSNYSKWQAFELAKMHGKTVYEMFEKPKWVGGTESAMFNRLEEIACSDNPTTPFLGCRLSRALEPKIVPNDQYLPTRINWIVQSGAVDFLHLMLVSMRWLLGERIRFSLSFHDEIRYLVAEEHKYEAALAMHLTNLLTRSFCCIKLGLIDIPQSIAFFTSVELDKVLRKESKQDCLTPSNPHGLEKGYKIPNGESLNIYQALEKYNKIKSYKCLQKDKR